MTETTMAVRAMRYGVDEDLPARRTLRAGPVTAVVEGGDLRYVTVAGREVIRRLYVGVREQNWGTIAPRYSDYTVSEDADGFRVTFTAEHDNGDVAFTWEGVIAGSSDGTIAYSLDGRGGRSFLRNRIGFCVLHPTELAGLAAEVETPGGLVQSAFPVLISPHQPFLDMVAISHDVGPDGGGRVTIRFDGDLFEAEDQRNWTDASYKTYSTPLRIPYPVRIEAGERVTQRVTLSVTGASAVAAAVDDAGPDITIGDASVGTLPPIGFGAAEHRGPMATAAVEALRALAPSHLWVSLDLGGDGWVDRLSRASLEARALETGLEFSVIADEDGGDGLGRLARALGDLRVPVERVLVFPPVQHPITFPRGDLSTTPEVLARANAAFAAAGSEILLGGGTRAYFTEFNRASGTMPVGEMAVAGYTINPQVHAFDNLSLVETLGAQALTVQSAKVIAGETPLVVGPVTLLPPFNPNATAPAPPVGRNELPPSVDPRQLSLFGAGWTLGSIRHLASTGVASLTYYMTTGWHGLIERRDGLTRRALFPSTPGQLFPLYHVFAAAAEFARGEVLPVTIPDQFGFEALAVRRGGRTRILVASFQDDERLVSVTFPGRGGAQVRVLDETTYAAAATDPAFFRGEGGEAVAVNDGRVTLRLRPFAVALLDIAS